VDDTYQFGEPTHASLTTPSPLAALRIANANSAAYASDDVLADVAYVFINGPTMLADSFTQVITSYATLSHDMSTIFLVGRSSPCPICVAGMREGRTTQFQVR